MKDVDIKEEITASREAIAIMLERDVFSGTIIIVEGSTDKLFYSNLVDEEQCRIIVTIAGSSRKKRAIDVLTILEKSDFPGILAIVDADFDHLDAIVYPSQNLFLTDTHDTETMMLRSAALERILAEYGSEDKIFALPQDVRTLLVNAGMPIGYLRWTSQKDGLNLTFEGIKFSKFLDEKSLILDEIKLIQTVQDKSQNWDLKSDRLSKQTSSEYDPWQICCGHDLVKILAIGLRHVFGTVKKESEDLETSLRLTYRPQDFLETQLCQKLKEWEIQHDLSSSILNVG